MEQTKRTIIIMSVIVVLMTLLGYICGMLSHNVIIYKEAQQECYTWLEEKCPCLFDTGITPIFEGLNLTGGQNVQENQVVS